METDGSGPERFLPESSTRLADQFARLDPGFAEVWSTHVSRLTSRTVLDDRTRFLVLTAQYTVNERAAQLEENLEAAVRTGVDPRELLEVILQVYVYTGPWVVSAACEVYERVMEHHDGVATPASEVVPDRDMETERQSWSAADRDDPRLAGLLERYGWMGISNGLRLRPGHHINMIDTLDALDPAFLATWLDAVYEGMYGRGVLDDRTRLLCVVGATLSLGETHQSRRHMRAALRSGAHARDVLEVVFLTTAFFGHPYVMPAAFDDLIRIADDMGRIDELVPAERVDDVRRIVAARVARRGGIQDDIGRQAPG
jgi:alkylhydroperoxidase/carboxymuconolactone decarboxylase family protein YurZ